MTATVGDVVRAILSRGGLPERVAVTRSGAGLRAGQVWSWMPADSCYVCDERPGACIWGRDVRRGWGSRFVPAPAVQPALL
jgi:hypothetical protein